MPPSRRLVLQPERAVSAEAPDRWRVEGPDARFRVEGPFARGVWELHLTGCAAIPEAYDSVRVEYPSGGAQEVRSVRFPGLGLDEAEHRIYLWLPSAVEWLRIAPSAAAGPIRLNPIEATRRSPVMGVLAGISRRLFQAPRKLLRDLRQIGAVFGNRHERNRLLVDLATGTSDDGYERWLVNRVSARASAYPYRAEPHLFSIVTTAFDTPAEFVEVLGRSILEQKFRDFEWLILDNGSRRLDTKHALAQLARDSRVRLIRIEQNAGIIGGMRMVLERATSRYVLPIDSDDYLFEDALAIVASVVQRHEYPALLYSDEDKLRHETHTDAFLKPDWDPVLLRNCCYIAHLCAIDRKRALELGVYTDPAAEGCHDWDTFLRFARAGHEAVHVPEIVYSWRMHAASTAHNVDSKAFVIDSQRHVLERHLEKTGIANRLEIVRSPFFPTSPDWWPRRRRIDPPPVALVVHTSDDNPLASVIASLSGYPVSGIWICGPNARQPPNRGNTPLGAHLHVIRDGLASAVREAAVNRPSLIAIVDSSVVPIDDEWIWEMVGLKEAFPECAVVGGRILDDSDRLVAAAGVFGFGGGRGFPDRLRSASDPGYFGLALKQRSASFVSGALCGVDPEFAVQFVKAATAEELAFDLSLTAWQKGRRVLFSPFVQARRARALQLDTGVDDELGLPDDSRYYHVLLSRSSASPFQPRLDARRR
jgi:Glycosyl transferase family 2